MTPMRTLPASLLAATSMLFCFPAAAQSALELEQAGVEASSPESLPPPDPAARAQAMQMLGTTGILLIPDSTNDRIMAFNPVDGSIVDPDFVPPTMGIGTGIEAILAADGNSILLSDQIGDVVHRFDLDGNYLGVFAPAGGANTAIMDNIRGIALDAAGNLLVTSASGTNADAVVRFDTAGNNTGTFIPTGGGGLDSPFDIYGRTGDWLLASIDSDNLIRYDLAGTGLGEFAQVVTFPEQIAEAANGNVLVANFSNSTTEGVIEFGPNGGAQIGRYDPVGLGGYRGVFELGNGNILTTTGAGVHEIDRAGNLVQTELSGVSARFITLLVLDADLSITLTDSPDPVIAGGQLSYTATLTNNGPGAAADASIALPLPAGTSFVSATPSAGGSCTNTSPVSCTWAGATAPAEVRSATVVVQVAANVANNTVLSATATASSGTNDPDPANNTATADTTVNTQADIAMTAFADTPDPVSAGTNLSYQVAMINNGLSDAQNARFSLPLPAGTSFVSAAPSAGGSCTNTSPVTCTWAGATMPGTSRSATIVALVAPSVLQGTTLNALVTGSSDTTDPVAGNNTLAASTAVNAVADLQIALTASAPASELGQAVTFTATSTNGGPSDAQNVVLSITLSPDFRYGSHTASAGAVCTTPQIGTTGVISCTWAGATAPGAVRTLALDAASFVPGTSSIQAATSSDTTDPVPQSNNVASTSVLVGNPVEAIPTLSQWSLVLLSLLVGLIGVAMVRRD